MLRVLSELLARKISLYMKGKATIEKTEDTLINRLKLQTALTLRRPNPTLTHFKETASLTHSPQGDHIPHHKETTSLTTRRPHPSLTHHKETTSLTHPKETCFQRSSAHTICANVPFPTPGLPNSEQMRMLTATD